MSLSDQQLELLRSHVLAKLGDPSALIGPDLTNKGLALAIIDSIQSTGVRYGSVGGVLERYSEYRRSRGGDPASDGTEELLMTFAQLGGPLQWATRIGNQHKTSTAKDAPLKAVAVEAAAKAMSSLGIHDRSDMQAAARDADRLGEARTAWCNVTAQRSGITWRYVLMLAGVPGVKPDRMIRGFVADALKINLRRVHPDDAAELVERVAEGFGISSTTLDHAIWKYQRDPKQRAVSNQTRHGGED
ncbi:hypothetical protein [Nakamurella aerolata]|uniref:Heme peroxidase n=1 Tax=Nakamurella aerolata TaxID=1656892 RepID=A0A849ABD3_9ACTN|nr:hypothetical protein [Nakamurella aerolata]NNG36896.1 hypothetical protein [Nakamurella aerolata]